MFSARALETRNAALRQIEAEVSQGGDRFPIDTLPLFNVRVISTSFTNISRKPELNPCYFNPYPRELLTPPREEVFDRHFPKYNPDPKEPAIEHARSLWYYLRKYLPECGSRRPDVKSNIFYDLGWRKVSDIKFRNIWEYDTGFWPKWYVESVYVFAGPESTMRPHTKCAMVSDFNGDNETLLRAEIIGLSRIMRRRNVASHEVQPVLMFSMMGPRHLRILQAHWSGIQMVIQKSELYDLRHEDEDVLKLLSRWFLSRPIGETSLV